MMDLPKPPPKVVKPYFGTSPYYDADESWIASTSSLVNDTNVYPFGPKGVDRIMYDYTSSRTNIKAGIIKLMNYVFGPGEKEIRGTAAHKVLAKTTHDCLYQSFPGDVKRAKASIRKYLDSIGGRNLDSKESLEVILHSYEPFNKFMGQSDYDRNTVHLEKLEWEVIRSIPYAILFFLWKVSESSFQPVFPKMLFRKLVQVLANEPGWELNRIIRVVSGMVLTFARTVVRFTLQLLDQYVEMKHERSSDGDIQFYVRSSQPSNSPINCTPEREDSKSDYNWDFLDIKLKVLTKKSSSYVEMINDEDRQRLFATMLQPDQKFVDPMSVVEKYTCLTNKCFMDQLFSMTAVFQDSFRCKYFDIMNDENILLKGYLISILRRLIPLFTPFFTRKGGNTIILHVCDSVFPSDEELAELNLSPKLLCRIAARPPSFFNAVQQMAGTSGLSLSKNGLYLHVINAICQNFQFFFYHLMFHLCRPLLKVATVENAGPAERPFRIYSRDYFERTFPGRQKQKTTLQSPPSLEEKEEVHDTEVIDKKAKKRKRESTPENSVGKGTDAGSQSILSDVEQESEEKRFQIKDIDNVVYDVLIEMASFLMKTFTADAVEGRRMIEEDLKYIRAPDIPPAKLEPFIDYALAPFSRFCRFHNIENQTTKRMLRFLRSSLSKRRNYGGHASKMLFNKLTYHLTYEKDSESDLILMISSVVLIFGRTVVRYAMLVLNRYVEFCGGNDNHIRFRIRTKEENHFMAKALTSTAKVTVFLSDSEESENEDGKSSLIDCKKEATKCEINSNEDKESSQKNVEISNSATKDIKSEAALKRKDGKKTRILKRKLSLSTSAISGDEEMPAKSKKMKRQSCKRENSSETFTKTSECENPKRSLTARIKRLKRPAVNKSSSSTTNTSHCPGSGLSLYDRIYAKLEQNEKISEDGKIIFSMMLEIARNLERHNTDLELAIAENRHTKKIQD